MRHTAHAEFDAMSADGEHDGVYDDTAEPVRNAVTAVVIPALLDTCVLLPQLVNDTLLRLAAGQTYQPRWSADVLEDPHRNLVLRTGTAAARRRLYRMQRAFPVAEVSEDQHRVEPMQCCLHANGSWWGHPRATSS